MKPPFGFVVRDIREAQGLSVNALARASGLNVGYLSRLEAGRFTPKSDNLRRLADALHVAYDDMLALSGQERPALPTLQPYLRAAYGLSERSAADIERYITEHYGASPGPRDGEDESDDTSANNY